MLTRPNLILNTQRNSVQTEILFLIKREITKITESVNNKDSLIEPVVSTVTVLSPLLVSAGN